MSWSSTSDGSFRRRLPAVRWAAVTLVLVIGLTTALVWWSASIDATVRQRDLERHGEMIGDRVVETGARAGARLHAVSSLFRASETVTAAEFGTFVADVGLDTGMRAIVYAEIVDGRGLAAFVHDAQQRFPGFAAFELTDSLDPQPITPRSEYFLVLFMEPAEEFTQFIGADLGSVRWLRGAMERTAATGQQTATAQFRRAEGDLGSIAVIHPVTTVEGELHGVIAGVMDLEELVAADLGDAVPSTVSWSLVDVSPDRTARFSVSEAAWHTTVDVLGRRWRVEVSPSETAPGGWTAQMSMILAAGVLASLASAGFVFAAIRRLAGRRENERLAALSTQKDQFLAEVSHELRTPLTAVLGFIDELRMQWDTLDPDEREDLLSLAGDEAGEMAALVDDLLVGARLEAGNPLVVADGVLDMVAEVASVIGRLSRARGTEVEVSGFGWANGDRVRVRQILRNVLDNAFKHGAPPVRVTVDVVGDWCLVAVADAGEGVPECCRQSIFSVDASQEGHDHVRVSNSNRLGLPVSAYLARLMGGDLVYEADDHCFVLRLPTAPPDEARAGQRLMEMLVT